MFVFPASTVVGRFIFLRLASNEFTGGPIDISQSENIKIRIES